MRGILLSLLLLTPAGLFPQEIIINELYNSSSSDEWIELLILQDGLDLRDSDIRDFTSGGSPQDPLRFLPVPLWSSLHAGTVILAFKPDAPFTEDLDPSDHLLMVSIDNDSLFEGTLFLFAGSSDAIQVRDSLGGHRFGISWGSANEGSLPPPHVHFTDASASNTSASFEGDGQTDLTDPAQWIRSNESPTPGAGNNAANEAWIEELRGTIAAVHTGSDERPARFELLAAYPNPFNGMTEVGFRIPASGRVSLTILDLLGREVAVLLDEDLPAGSYRKQWDAGAVASGMYLYRLTAGGRSEVRKLILLR